MLTPIHATVGDQGEVYFCPVPLDQMPIDVISLTPDQIDKKNQVIIAHSESGHHHVLELEPSEVKYSPSMDVFFAILKNPTALVQDAAKPHQPFMIPANELGQIQAFYISKEWDSLQQQARRVAD